MEGRKENNTNNQEGEERKTNPFKRRLKWRHHYLTSWRHFYMPRFQIQFSDVLVGRHRCRRRHRLHRFRIPKPDISISTSSCCHITLISIHLLARLLATVVRSYYVTLCGWWFSFPADQGYKKDGVVRVEKDLIELICVAWEWTD